MTSFNKHIYLVNLLKEGQNFKIISTFSIVYSQCQVKIMQFSYKHLKCFPDIHNMFTQKQASFTVTPPHHGETEFHIHICDTSPHSDARLSGIGVF